MNGRLRNMTSVYIMRGKKFLLPYSAKYVLEHYLETGASDHKMYVGAANGERVVFSELPEY